MQHDQVMPHFRRPPRLIKDTRPENSGFPAIEPFDVATQPTSLQPVISPRSLLSIEQIEQMNTQVHPITPAYGFAVASDPSDPSDVSEQATRHLMQLSGMMPAI